MHTTYLEPQISAMSTSERAAPVQDAIGDMSQLYTSRAFTNAFQNMAHSNGESAHLHKFDGLPENLA